MGNPVIQNNQMKFGTMVRRQFQSKRQLLMTLTYTRGASIKIIDVQRMTSSFRVSLFISVNASEFDTADVDLSWPGLEHEMINLAAADAVIDEAISKRDVQPTSPVWEDFDGFIQENRNLIHQIHRLFNEVEAVGVSQSKRLSV